MGASLAKKLSCGLYKPSTSRKNTGHVPINDHISILVIGDEGVGKTTLINNFVSESQNVDVNTENDELIRIVNANQTVQNPSNPDETHQVSLTIVDVNGGINNINKQIRDGYYTTCQMIFILYNVSNNMTLYNAGSVWQQEIDEATRKLSEKQANEVQLVLVGVQPEARDDVEELNADNFETNFMANDETKELFRRTSQRKSVNRKNAQNVSRSLSFKKSARATAHHEVKTTKGNIKSFFAQQIVNYIFFHERKNQNGSTE